MKKMILGLLLAITTLSAKAQFEQGTSYLNTSLSGLDLSFQKHQFNFGLDVKGGYFFEDAWMVYGQMEYDFTNIKGRYNDANQVALGAGLRYYIEQNGLFLNLGLKYGHTSSWGLGTGIGETGLPYLRGVHNSQNNIFLTPELGYCFYLNHYLSVEPSVYYEMSLNHFSSGSKVGLRVGFGFYF